MKILWEIAMQGEEANQEAERKIGNDGERNCNSRELHISYMPNKDVCEGVDTIVAQYVKGNRPCN